MAAARSNQLIVSLIVACAMFMQNLDCKAKTHPRDEGHQTPEVSLVFWIVNEPGHRV
jgi:hypothetical protein